MKKKVGEKLVLKTVCYAFLGVLIFLLPMVAIAKDRGHGSMGETFIQETGETIRYKIVDGVAYYKGAVLIGDLDEINANGISLAGHSSEPELENNIGTEDGQMGETFIQETGETIEYEIEDGLAYYYNDILLGEPDVIDEEGVPLSRLNPPEDNLDAESEQDTCPLNGNTRQSGQTFIQGTNQTINYAIVNGLAIFEGDIVLGDVETVEVEGVPPLSSLSEETSNDETLLQWGFSTNGGKFIQWPKVNNKYYEVYYMFYRSGKHLFSASEKRTVQQAMAEIEKVSLIRFIPFYGANACHIKFVKEDGCWSYIGRLYNIGGGVDGENSQAGQRLSLGEGCIHKGTIVHELLHALGFIHEHNKPGRKNYINIHWENIRSAWVDQFKLTRMCRYNDVYDFSSIMHYGSTAFGKKGPNNTTLRTITAKDPKMTSVIGQRNSMSHFDIEGLKLYYGK